MAAIHFISGPPRSGSTLLAALLRQNPRRHDQESHQSSGLQPARRARRHLRSNNSWLHNVPSMVKGRDRCTALMHPADATARALTDCAPVTVTSRIGSIVVTLEVSDDIRPGTIAIPHGWGHREPGVGWQVAASLPGANVNLLHDPSLTDTFTGNAAVNNTWVAVTPAAGEKPQSAGPADQKPAPTA
jgi:predicted molibdopterin-dependent oxidoreductase YjgC